VKVPSDIVPIARQAVRAFVHPRAAGRNGRACAVTLITPIVPGQTDTVKEVLGKFETGQRSPLARLSGVHFGRWVVIDGLRTDWPGAPQPPPTLKSDYLMFTADVTSETGELDTLPDSLFAEIAERIPDEAHAVWRNCFGYPGVASSAAFVHYLSSSAVDTGLYYAAYPDATVDEIRKALRIRESLAAFVLGHPDMSASTLKDEYMKAAESWCSSS
jgi:hypothetical protein